MHLTKRQWLGRSVPAAAAILGGGLLSPSPAATESRPQTRDWFGREQWPPFERVEALLKHWAKKHPRITTLEPMAQSAQGRAIYAIRLTDPDADDSAKEHALITGLHSGLERSGTTTILHIMEWLLSGEPRAKEILSRQSVVFMPIPDPDRYEAGQVSPVYGAWTLDGPRDASPEAIAVKQIMDRHRPEVHADIHGVDMTFERYIMFENSGSSYSNFALRPYHRDIIRQMDEAALAEGFSSDLAESDGERLLWGPNLEPMKERLWHGRPQIYAAIYCYHHYHTIPCASEVRWERSGLLRHRRLLEIGNETWPGEYRPGYPTRIIMANTHTMLAAYGNTAAARRDSRVELWGMLGRFTFGFLDPVVDGKAVCVCATSSQAARKWLCSPTLKATLERLKQHPGVDSENLARFAANWPPGQNGPEPMFALQGAAASTAEKQTDATPIRHGLCLRLRLPYGNAKLLDLRLNGHPAKKSDTDGYSLWSARACTYIQINLPPESLGQDDIFIVTCDYDPGEVRKPWDAWRKISD